VSSYPRVFTLEPIGEWPTRLTERRQEARFRTPGGVQNGKYVAAARVPIRKTMQELATTFDKIGAKEPRLQIAALSEDFTLDGRLRAGRKPWHPGVILSFETPAGVQRYPSDYYTHWEDNLRAIALTLEALRAIDRWHVGNGEQFRGFLAIESGTPMPGSAAPFADSAGAEAWLREFVGVRLPMSAPVPKLLREAKIKAHPDIGGDHNTMALVNLAGAIIQKEGTK